MRIIFFVGLIHVIGCRTEKGFTLQNSLPKAEIISHSDGDAVLEGFSTRFVGNVTDANHPPEQLTTIWYLDGEVVCDGVIPDQYGSTECNIALTSDASTITLAVLDADNGRGENSILLSVMPTEAPVAEIVTPTVSGVYYADQKITFEGLISDAEDDVALLSAFWESDIDGELTSVSTEADSTGAIIGYGYLAEGEHALELHVTDSTGKTARDTVIFTVGPPNSAPTCSIDSPLNGSAGAEGELVFFTGTAEDVDVSPSWLSVAWTSDKDGELGTSTPNSDGSIGFAFSDLSVDTHNITLSVTDEVGAVCTASVFYTVGTPPTVTIDSPVNGELVSEGAPVSFSVTVVDTEDQPNDVGLDWVLNGISISTQSATSSGTATFSSNTLQFGTYNLVVTATDTDGLTDSEQVNFTVNGLPTQPIVSIIPTSPTTQDTLYVGIDSPSTDPEGSTPTYSYEWQLGGQTQSAYISSSLPSGATQKGQQWTVVVTPNDGIANGTSGLASVVIGNTPPSVGVVSITPTGNIVNDDVLTCSAVVSDPDETPLSSYAWSVGGNVVGTASTLDLSTTGISPSETIICTVTATDGDGATGNNVASVIISNRSPSITASINGNGSNQNAILTCLGNATDPDGDTPIVTYEWFNGTNSLGTSNPLHLNSTIVASGDIVECVATATDTNGATATATATHTVTNTAPIINNVSLTPNPAIEGVDDLTCTVSGTDPDGDSILYSYVWSDSTGVQQTTNLVSDTTDVFLGSGTTVDTWTCEVTPFDGVIYGNPDSDSTLVETGCSSLFFNGADSRVTIPQSSALDVTIFTTMFWVYLDPTTVNGGHLLVKGDNGTNEWSITYSSNSFNFNRQGLYQAMTTSANFQPGAWHHVAVTYDGSLAKMYIDGQEETSTSFNFSPSATPLVIGNIGSCHNCAMFGNMYEVSFFNQVLNSTEITDVYTGIQAPTQFGSLVGFWPLNHSNGSFTSDMSGNGLDGTIVSGTWDSTCPDEDLDGDGFGAWEDCDDSDASIPSINDLDCDGYTVSDGDCDDLDATMYPFAGDTYNDGVDSDCDGLDCEADYNGTTYFAACPTETDWNNAQNTCTSSGYNGLATIQNSTENAFLHSLQPIQSSSSYYWIGLNDIASENSFQWTSGLPTSYLNWNNGEPNNVNNEDCVHIYGSSSVSAPRWNDMPCSNQIYFICEQR